MPKTDYPEVVQRKMSGVQRRGIHPQVIRQIGDEDARTLRFRSSEETADRFGDLIIMAGFRLENFRKNPRFLYEHSTFKVPPIGTSIKEKVIPEKDGVPSSLEQDIVFAPPTMLPFADVIFRMYRGVEIRGRLIRFLDAVSVGFNPLVVEFIEDEDRRAELGLGRFGVVFKEQDLLESSAVGIPAHPNAVQLNSFKSMIQHGYLNKDDVEIMDANISLHRPLQRVWREAGGGLVVFPALAATDAATVREYLHKHGDVIGKAMPEPTKDATATDVERNDEAAVSKNVRFEEDGDMIKYIVREVDEFSDEPAKQKFTDDPNPVWAFIGEHTELEGPAIQMMVFLISEGWDLDSAKSWVEDNLDDLVAFDEGLRTEEQSTEEEDDDEEKANGPDEEEDDEERQEETTEVQSLILSKDTFPTREEATQWVTDNDFTADKVDETDDSWRFRQRDPADFDEDSLRTIDITDGVKAVVGRLKESESGEAEEQLTLSEEQMNMLLTIQSSVNEFVESVIQGMSDDDAEEPDGSEEDQTSNTSRGVVTVANVLEEVRDLAEDVAGLNAAVRSLMDDDSSGDDDGASTDGDFHSVVLEAGVEVLAELNKG